MTRRESLMRGIVTAAIALCCSTAADARPVDAEGEAKRLTASPAFRDMSDRLARDYDRIVGEVTALTQIPAPPFKEVAKAQAFAAMLRDAGVPDVAIDAEGNVSGLRKGSGRGDVLVVAAHLDTVFPEGTDVTVRRDGARLRAPGIGDDDSGLAVLLAFARAIDAAHVRTKADILFVGDVGEEGPGNLRGVRFLFANHPLKRAFRAFVTLEPQPAASIINTGVGSKRYEIDFHGPGGHSYHAFGLVNPAYALGDAMARIGQIKVPTHPVTTYNVGVVEGGTSVNSIPIAMTMQVDMRSEGQESLDTLEKAILAIPQGAADRENAARSTAEGRITVTVKPLGDRPVGRVPENAAIARVAVAAARSAGLSPSFTSGSTDANLPMSLGIAALSLPAGFDASRQHSLDESLLLDKPRDLANMRAGLATILLLAGTER